MFLRRNILRHVSQKKDTCRHPFIISFLHICPEKASVLLFRDLCRLRESICFLSYTIFFQSICRKKQRMMSLRMMQKMFYKPVPAQSIYMQIIDIQGKYTSARIFTTDNSDTAVDSYALAQIRHLCNLPCSEGTTVRVMPDFHPGNGCVIGLTMTLQNSVMPNLVGMDIGCGVSCYKIRKAIPDFQKLDTVIRDHVPSGFNIHTQTKSTDISALLDTLVCRKHIRKDQALCSLGSLGSGNHFIEVDQDEDQNHWLLIHSGSRHLGVEVCTSYLKQGEEQLKKQGLHVPFEETWIEGGLFHDYLHDMQIATVFASENRHRIAQTICKKMGWKIEESFESIHNYISRDNILRKGAISAEGICIIPINMQEGCLIGQGKKNAEWSFPAPHGAGRIVSRSKAREQFTVTEFKKAMTGIFSTCIGRSTIDESPFVYRRKAEIAHAIEDTVTVLNSLSPVYSFKHGGK